MAEKYKSKRLKEHDFIENGLPENFGYCRKCREVKRAYFFHKATDQLIDSSGLFSVCKSCVAEIYSTFLRDVGGVPEKAILKMCSTFNIIYNEDALNAAKKQMDSKNIEDEDNLFAFYRAKLIVVYKSNITDKASEIDLSFRPDVTINMPEREIESDSMEELIQFWGTDNKQDIEFLEKEYSNFKQSHKADTYSEITLLKQVCYKLLDMDKDRRAGRSTDSSLKQLMDVMKNLAISPSMTNAASAGKGVDTFGNWIKDIENLRPAEWVEDKNIWKDVDDLETYTQENIISPIRSFITGNREFTLEGTESSEEEDE